MSESDNHRSGPTSLGKVMPRLRSALGGKPSPILTLIGVWPEIVGPELARQSRPEKLTGARAANGQTGSGTLHLRCTGAAALELQHRGPEVIQRVNAFMGFTAVAKIALVQGPLPQSRPTAPTRLAVPVDAATRRSMLQAAENVSSPELRAALKRLADAIARDPAPTSHNGKR
ncbi:MAG: DciA family protein [Rhodospirillales bacterium]